MRLTVTIQPTSGGPAISLINEGDRGDAVWLASLQLAGECAVQQVAALRAETVTPIGRGLRRYPVAFRAQPEVDLNGARIEGIPAALMHAGQHIKRLAGLAGDIRLEFSDSTGSGIIRLQGAVIQSVTLAEWVGMSVAFDYQVQAKDILFE